MFGGDSFVTTAAASKREGPRGRGKLQNGQLGWSLPPCLNDHVSELDGQDSDSQSDSANQAHSVFLQWDISDVTGAFHGPAFFSPRGI
jgi:hypothetical protein